MISRGRLNELKNLHRTVSAGGNCFGLKDLQRHLPKPVQHTQLPHTTYEKDFIDLFQEETARLEELDKRLRETIEQYALKRDLHREFYHQKANLREKGPSKLDLVVESAQDLPATEVYFLIKKNGTMLYKSMVKSKKANPVWNERYTVGVTRQDAVFIEIIEAKSEKCIGSLEVNLKSLEDQLVHTRHYNVGKWKLIMREQWIYDQIAFHKIYSEIYDHMYNEEEALLEVVSRKLNNMFTLEGDKLLQAWFCEKNTERRGRNMKIFLNYESVGQSTVTSLVNTPTATTVETRYSRPIDLSEIIPSKNARQSHSLNRGSCLNFFCIGMYKSYNKK